MSVVAEKKTREESRFSAVSNRQLPRYSGRTFALSKPERREMNRLWIIGWRGRRGVGFVSEGRGYCVFTIHTVLRARKRIIQMRTGSIFHSSQFASPAVCLDPIDGRLKNNSDARIIFFSNKSGRVIDARPNLEQIHIHCSSPIYEFRFVLSISVIGRLKFVFMAKIRMRYNRSEWNQNYRGTRRFLLDKCRLHDNRMPTGVRA